MDERILELVKSRPILFDSIKKIKNRISPTKRPSQILLDQFSRTQNGKINFIQIGANDGLRNDPIRFFVVRDKWNGLFVEPLPNVFPLLKKNYAYLKNPNLFFLNAAISDSESEILPFYSFNTQFLDRFSEGEKLDFLRKSSFEKEHLLKFIDPKENFDDILTSIDVKCMTLKKIVDDFFKQDNLDLLVIDVEGYEQKVISQINSLDSLPKAVFFEIRHMGPSKEDIFLFLENLKYKIHDLKDDAFAVLK